MMSAVRYVPETTISDFAAQINVLYTEKAQRYIIKLLKKKGADR